MNFTSFYTAFTNIFPAANSKIGGQLLSEFNLRSRETVGTNSAIKYSVGSSYAHSQDDFKIRRLTDETGVEMSTSILEVMPGRAIVNGHYVETLSSMTVDLIDANATLKSQSKAPLKGKLAIGIRVFYATEQTMAGTLLVENQDQAYQGVQLVILPEEELITPDDSPEDSSLVTAHLRLGTFIFSNNTISNIINLTSKCQYIHADRITGVEGLISDSYVRKSGLNSKKIYAFAGKGTDPATGYDTWEDVTDSMMVWDNNPQRTLEAPVVNESQFTTLGDNVYLTVPHKQVEGMQTSSGIPEYYADRNIKVPNADYGKNTPGLVDSSYTKHIKELANEVSEFRRTLNGKQIMYMPIKDADTPLPPINTSWSVGDYILVGQDLTVDDSSDGVRPPSTLYTVLPGLVQEIEYLTSVVDSDVIPSSLTGVQLGYIEDDEIPSTDTPELYPQFFTPEDLIRGMKNEDYFVYIYRPRTAQTYTKYYYKVSVTGPRGYSDYIPLTGEIPFAQESVIGGFLNVPADAIDAGYVYRDEYGRLKLVDYSLLRSGTLAYQLGEDITLPNGLTTDEIQSYLDDYVNDRVAFANSTKLAHADPEIINVYINISAQEDGGELNIKNVDSRFNTTLYLHILGEAGSNVTVNISNCQKLRIDNDIQGSPVINVVDSSLFYDPYVFNYIRDCHATSTGTGFYNLKIWYQMYEESDPQLVVDNMTVSQIGVPPRPDNLSFWNETQPNDNHYLTALRSITFSSEGNVVGCELYVANQSTDNVLPGEKVIVADFELPQGSGLTYPKSCLTKQLKIVGSFVSAYKNEVDNNWFITDTTFGALTAVADPYNTAQSLPGNIAFHSNTTVMNVDMGQSAIPVWETDTYSIFKGGAIL